MAIPTHVFISRKHVLPLIMAMIGIIKLRSFAKITCEGMSFNFSFHPHYRSGASFHMSVAYTGVWFKPAAKNKCKSCCGQRRPPKTPSGHLLAAMLLFILIFKAVVPGCISTQLLRVQRSDLNMSSASQGIGGTLDLSSVLVQRKSHLETGFSSYLSKRFLSISNWKGKKCPMTWLAYLGHQKGSELWKLLCKVWNVSYTHNEHLIYSPACQIHDPTHPWPPVREEVPEASCPALVLGAAGLRAGAAFWIFSSVSFSMIIKPPSWNPQED